MQTKEDQAQRLDDMADALHKMSQHGSTKIEDRRALQILQDRMDEMDCQRQKADLYTGTGGSIMKGNGPVLGVGQKVAPHLREESHNTANSASDFEPTGVRLGALLAGFCNWNKTKSQLTEDEHKVFSTLIGPGGDLLIPNMISGSFIDAVRPRTAVIASGAMTYALEGRSVAMPGWDVAPKAGWRGENGSFADGGGTFREVRLNARDVGAYADIPNNLFDDAADNLPAISQLIEDELAQAIAQAIDLAALTSQDVLSGGGTQVPQGLTSVAADGTVTPNYGIPTVTMGANGAIPIDWDKFIDLASTVNTANFTPSSCLMAPRTAATLGKFKETTGAYIARPDYLAGVMDRQTAQLGVTFKKGSASDTSIAIAGDYSQLVVGFLGGLTVLRDPYTQGLSNGTRIIVSMRADVAVLNAGAFCVLDGIRA